LRYFILRKASYQGLLFKIKTKTHVSVKKTGACLITYHE
jgi:hypothetical protein